MKHRIVVAVTGASGSIYARQLLNKLTALKDQVDQVAIVMTDNARTVWQTELDEKGYEQLPFPFFSQHDFHAPLPAAAGALIP